MLAQNWNSASVFVSTAAALGLLGIWVLIALAARRWSDVVVWPRFRLSRMLRALAVAGLAAVSLVAVTQMTSHVSQAATPAQAQSTTGFVAATGLKPPDQIAVAFSIGTNSIPATDVRLLPVGPAGVRGVLDRAGVLQPGAGPAGRGGRGRDRLADRPARVGQLAAPPGRMADRGRQPGGGLGRLAARLTGDR